MAKKVIEKVYEYVDEKILSEKLEELVGTRFGAYSKYIIQDRAIPDARDGLKPVQRRILYGMYKLGLLSNKPYKKSARIVGEVMGKYHPHGDSSIYEALVRLSQDFKTNLPLIDMHGNNGSIDGDPAAAMRYTEARLSLVSEYLLQDILKDTVSFVPNFDDEEYEPTVLPSKFPNLLVNGTTGISAGYATDIPPHNLGEVIDAVIYRMDNPKCEISDLIPIIKGPDFPTGGIIVGTEGIEEAYKTGKGRITIRSKTEFDGTNIIVHEIPYDVNKAQLVKKIDEIRIAKKVNGIIEVRDESDREGLRIAIELRKDANQELILNYLLKNTDLQRYYTFNMVAIDNKRPVLMNLSMILDSYIKHQKDVVTNRSNYDLNKAKVRKHIVEGLIKMVSILDEVIHTIRSSKNKANAKENLVIAFGFSDEQAEAIVNLQLYRLTNTDVLALEKENKELDKEIAYLTKILSNQHELLELIKKELVQTKNAIFKPRMTKIQSEKEDIKIDTIDLVQKENVVVSVTKHGYVKRSSLRSYQASKVTDMGQKEDDYIINLTECTTLDTLLVFTNEGNYIYYPVYQIADSKWKDMGVHISNLVTLAPSEQIIYAQVVPNFSTNHYLLVATKDARIKLVKLSDLEVSRYNKKIRYINLAKGDEVRSVELTPLLKECVVMTRQTGFIKYDTAEVPINNTNTSGITAINMKNRPNDEVVFASLVNDNNDLIVLTTRGNIIRKNVTDLELKKRTNKPENLLPLIKSNPHDIFKVVKTTKQEYKDNLKLTLVGLEKEAINLYDLKYYTQSEFGKPYYKGDLKNLIDLVKVETGLKEVSEEVIEDDIKNAISDDSIFIEEESKVKKTETNLSQIDIFSIIDEDPDINNLK